MILKLTGVQGNKLLVDLNVIYFEEITPDMNIEGSTRLVNALFNVLGQWVLIKETIEEIEQQIKEGGIK